LPNASPEAGQGFPPIKFWTTLIGCEWSGALRAAAVVALAEFRCGISLFLPILQTRSSNELRQLTIF
jgi:hypothetical protein